MKEAGFPRQSLLVQGIQVYGWPQISSAMLFKLLPSCLLGVRSASARICRVKGARPEQRFHKNILALRLGEPSHAATSAGPCLRGGWPPVP